MKKKRVLIVLAVVIALAVPFSVFAATSDTTAGKTIRGFFGIDTSKLTDQQKADVKDYTQKMGDLQKGFIDKMVGNGAMTKEQGEAAKSRIDDMIKNGSAKGFIPGFGMEKRVFEKHGGIGFGKIDVSKLTDKQKDDLLDTYKKMAELQREKVKKAASFGIITREQSEAAIARIDAGIKELQDKGFSNGIGIFTKGFCSFKGFAVRGSDPSKLTDAQKTELKEFSGKMGDLQKELVNKMVTHGLITKDQGDNAISKIDEMAKFSSEKGFMGGNGMRKGRFAGF